MNRRGMLRLAAAGSLPGSLAASLAQPGASKTPALEAILRTGGCAVMLRHAQTVPGVGDPPNFQLRQCSTQRNLSDEGRAQAAAIGRWFSSRALKPSSVWSSPWCRCKDTAAAFGAFNVLTALGSTFDGKSDATAQTAALRERLVSIAPFQFEVWVTHQVNVSALTGKVPAMGEALVLRANASGGGPVVLARTSFS